MVPPARVWLFTPGHQPERIEKALGLPVDAVLLDLEDAVPPDQRNWAVGCVIAACRTRRSGPLRYVRVPMPAPADGPTGAMDLAMAVQAGTDGLCLPKIRRPEEIAAMEPFLRCREKAVGLAVGSIRLLVIIETPQAVVRAPAIAASSPRISGLLFGAEDLALELGLRVADPGEEFLYARSAVAMAAASAGVQAVDRVYPDFRDPEGLQRDTARGRSLGFTGKAVIHPAQIDPVRAAFAPSPQEVADAREVVAAAEAADGGVTSLHGKMVDAPVVERARRVLDAVEKAGGGSE